MDSCAKERTYEGSDYFEVYKFCSDNCVKTPGIIDAPNEGYYKIVLANINYPIDINGFPPVANCATLLFIHPNAKQSGQCKEWTSYECFFARDYLSKKTVEVAQVMDLFNPMTPTAFLVSKRFERRIEEIFESMIEENLTMQQFRNEMLKNLITELVLFTQRLIPVELKS